MKRVLASFFLCLLAVSGYSQNNILIGNVGDYGLNPSAVTCTLTLLSPNPRVVNGFFVKRDPVTTTSAADGSFGFTNIIWGRYQFTIAGQVGTAWIAVIPTNTTVNPIPLAAYVYPPGTVALPLPDPSTNFYTQTQIDAKLAVIGAIGTASFATNSGTAANATHLLAGDTTSNLTVSAGGVTSTSLKVTSSGYTVTITNTTISGQPGLMINGRVTNNQPWSLPSGFSGSGSGFFDGNSNFTGSFAGTLVGNGSAITNYAPANLTLFVDATNGNDSTASIGQPNLPWQTLNAAIAASPRNSTIQIEPGVYYWPTNLLLRTNQSIVGSGTNNTFLIWTNLYTGMIIAPGVGLRDCYCISTNPTGSSFFIGSALTNYFGGSLRVQNCSFYSKTNTTSDSSSACIALNCYTNSATIEVYNSRMVGQHCYTFTISGVGQNGAQRSATWANTATFFNCYSDGSFGNLSGFSNTVTAYSCTFTNGAASASTASPNFCVEAVWNNMTLANCIINSSTGTYDVHAHSGILNLPGTTVNGSRIYTSYGSAINPGPSGITPIQNLGSPDNIDVGKFTGPNARGTIVFGNSTNRFLIHNGYTFAPLYAPPLNTNKVQVLTGPDGTYVGVYTFSNTITESAYAEAVYTNGSTPGRFLIYAPYANEDFGTPAGTPNVPSGTWTLSTFASATNQTIADVTLTTLNDTSANSWSSGTTAQMVPLEPGYYTSTNSLDAQVALNGSIALIPQGIHFKKNGVWVLQSPGSVGILTPEMFGAGGQLLTDDTAAVQACESAAEALIAKGVPTRSFYGGSYKMTSPLLITNKCNIIGNSTEWSGNGFNAFVPTFISSASPAIQFKWTNGGSSGLSIDGVYLVSSNWFNNSAISAGSVGLLMSVTNSWLQNYKVSHFAVAGFDKGILTTNLNDGAFENVDISNCTNAFASGFQGIGSGVWNQSLILNQVRGNCFGTFITIDASSNGVIANGWVNPAAIDMSGLDISNPTMTNNYMIVLRGNINATLKRSNVEGQNLLYPFHHVFIDQANLRIEGGQLNLGSQAFIIVTNNANFTLVGHPQISQDANGVYAYFVNVTDPTTSSTDDPGSGGFKYTNVTAASTGTLYGGTRAFNAGYFNDGAANRNSYRIGTDVDRTLPQLFSTSGVGYNTTINDDWIFQGSTGANAFATQMELTGSELRLVGLVDGGHGKNGPGLTVSSNVPSNFTPGTGQFTLVSSNGNPYVIANSNGVTRTFKLQLQ